MKTSERVFDIAADIRIGRVWNASLKHYHCTIVMVEDMTYCV
jgi:hypothetical protein